MKANLQPRALAETARNSLPLVEMELIAAARGCDKARQSKIMGCVHRIQQERVRLSKILDGWPP